MRIVDKVVPVATLAELKAHLRIEDEREDAIMAGWLRAATELVEQNVGQLLVERQVVEELTSDPRGGRLSVVPVKRIENVAQMDSEGSWQEIEAGSYGVELLADASARFIVSAGVDSGNIRVRYRAGIAEHPNELPELLRQAVIRIAAHWHAHRDSATVKLLPDSVREMLAAMRMPRFRASGA